MRRSTTRVVLVNIVYGVWAVGLAAMMVFGAWMIGETARIVLRSALGGAK